MSGLCVAQEGDSTMRNPSFALRSPQSGCSPAGSEGTPKRKATFGSEILSIKEQNSLNVREAK